MDQPFEQYVQDQEKAWLAQFSQYLSGGKVLKIGNGLGHSSEAIRQKVSSLTVIDVQTFHKTINKDRVVIYDGSKIPSADKSFDTAIIIFTLHHIPDSRHYFQEILRVTKKRIILLEETYDNVFQKAHLYYRDWLVNQKAHQPCELYWNSYFSRKELGELIALHGLKEVSRVTKNHKNYFKELVILDLP